MVRPAVSGVAYGSGSAHTAYCSKLATSAAVRFAWCIVTHAWRRPPRAKAEVSTSVVAGASTGNQYRCCTRSWREIPFPAASTGHLSPDILSQ